MFSNKPLVRIAYRAITVTTFLALIPMIISAQDNDEWLKLDAKLQQVMDASADSIDGYPMGSADAQRYNQMSQDALAWKYDFTNFTDSLDDDHWINAGVYDTEEHAISWWEEKGLHHTYGDPGSDPYNYQNPSYSIGAYTATISAYGSDSLYVEGLLSWRVGRFIFQVGFIQRPTHGELKQTLRKDAEIIINSIYQYDLFGSLAEVSSFAIIYTDVEAILQYNLGGFRFEALDKDGQIAKDFSTSATLTARDSAGKGIPLYPAVIQFIGGQCEEYFEFTGTGKKVYLEVTYLGIRSTSEPFEVKPWIKVELTGFTGSFTYDGEIILNVRLSQFDRVNWNPFAGEGTFKFSTVNEIGSLGDENSVPFSGNNFSMSYHTPSEMEAANITQIGFAVDVNISPWEVYSDMEFYNFPGGEGGESEEPTFEEVTSFGGFKDDEGSSITLTEDPGEMYISGVFYEGMMIGEEILETRGDAAFLMKYNVHDLDDNFVMKMGSEEDKDEVFGVVESKGTAVIAFNTAGRVGMGPNMFKEFEKGSNVVLGWRKPDGNSYMITGSGLKGSSSLDNSKSTTNSKHYGQDLVVDKVGNTIVTGYFEDDITFTGVSGTSQWTATTTHDNIELFLVKYSPDGEVLWGLHGTSEEDVEGSVLEVDADGNIYLTGHFDQTADIASFHFDESHGSFLVKLTPWGSIIWGNEISGSSEITGIILDQEQENFFICGTAKENVSFGDMIWEKTEEEYSRFFYAKFSVDGSPIWIKHAGTTSSNEWHEPKAIAIDQDNNIFMTGHFAYGDISFDDIFLSPDHITDDQNFLIFVAAIDQDGNALWAIEAGDNPGREARQETMGNSICVDDEGNCFVVGTYTGEILFGETMLTSTGKSDAFFVKIPKVNSGTSEIDVPILSLSPIQLEPNFPNPFSDQTTIYYSLSKSGLLSLKVHSILGSDILLEVEEDQSMGKNSLKINLQPLKPGIYIYQLQLDGGPPVVGKMMKVE
jgi:hypothetical protein